MPQPPRDRTIKMAINGNVVLIDIEDFDRREWRLLKDALGMGQVDILAAAATLDLDVLAGFAWLHLRREDPEVQYDDVNLRLGDVTDPRGTPDPPD